MMDLHSEQRDPAHLPITLAADFHDDRTLGAHAWSSCWCCCPECEMENPFFVTARAQLRVERGLS